MKILCDDKEITFRKLLLNYMLYKRATSIILQIILNL